MRIVIAIFMLFIALPSWAGTWLDNFDDGDFAEWRMDTCLWMPEIVTPGAGNWVVENGAVVAGDNNSANRYDLYIGDMSWTDYTAEISVKLSKKLEACSDSSGVWLGLRFQEGEGKLGLNDYAVGMWNDTGMVRWGGFKYSDGDFFNTQRIVFPSQTDTWYRLKIVVEDDQITAFVDDLRVFELRDGLFASGVVCIAVNGVKATFDNFMVTGPDIPDGGSGYSVELSGKLVTTWAQLRSIE